MGVLDSWLAILGGAMLLLMLPALLVAAFLPQEKRSAVLRKLT